MTAPPTATGPQHATTGRATATGHLAVTAPPTATGPQHATTGRAMATGHLAVTGPATAIVLLAPIGRTPAPIVVTTTGRRDHHVATVLRVTATTGAHGRAETTIVAPQADGSTAKTARGRSAMVLRRATDRGRTGTRVAPAATVPAPIVRATLGPPVTAQPVTGQPVTGRAAIVLPAIAPAGPASPPLLARRRGSLPAACGRPAPRADSGQPPAAVLVTTAADPHTDRGT